MNRYKFLALLLQKTTWAGIGSVVAGLAAFAVGNMAEGAAGVSAGIGLIFASDSSRSAHG